MFLYKFVFIICHLTDNVLFFRRVLPLSNSRPTNLPKKSI